MRVRMVVNPVASGVTEAVVEAVRQPLERVADVELVTTEGVGDGRRLAAESDADAIVPVGGDGIVNEVVNGLRPETALGVVPAGASSVFARQLGFPTDSRRAARLVAAAISAGSKRTISLGELNGRRFTFAASIGFDADTTGRVDDTRRHRRSHRRPSDARVVLLAVETLREDGFALREQMTVRADGGPDQRCSWLAVANQHPYTYFGRIPVKATPRARFEQGLDAVVAHELRAVDLWRLAVYGLFWPGHAAGAGGRIGYLHDRAAIDVECDRPIGHQLDGEYLGTIEQARIRHLAAALSVLVPPQQMPHDGSL